jgi:hypothetical protein
MTHAGAQRCHVSLTTDCIQPGLSSSNLSGFSPDIHATCLLTRSGDSGGNGTVSTLKSDTLYMEHPWWCNIHNVHRWYQSHSLTPIYNTKLRYDLTWSGWRSISGLHMKNEEAIKLCDCQTRCTITKTSTKESNSNYKTLHSYKWNFSGTLQWHPATLMLILANSEIRGSHDSFAVDSNLLKL